MTTDQSNQRSLCVDASVWVRFLTSEDQSEQTASRFEEWQQKFDFFLEPSFLLFEIVSAIRKKQKLRAIDPAVSVRNLLHELYKLPILLYQSEKLLRRTARLAEALEATDAYDSSYLALAIWKKIPFFTADRKFYEKAKPVYANTHLV